MSKKLFAMLLVLAMVFSIGGAAFADENTPLVVAYSPFSAKFSPFYADTAYDRDAVDITQLTILTTDRAGGIIYNAIEDVEDAMKGMLEPVFEEKVTGHAEVRQIFKSSGVGNIAGSIVTDGTLERDSGARIFRGDDMIYEGKLISLKRFKDDVKEVKSGFECGLVFEGFGEFLEGDRIECYKMVEVPRS